MKTRIHALGRLGRLLVSAAALAGALSAGSAQAAVGGRIRVQRLVFPVTLADGNTYDVVGYLYYRGSYRHRPLQVLVHGITYTHEYWDLPTLGGRDYSYARYMADRHYAVLALDLLGSGESSRPDGDFTDLAQTAESVHQVLDEMRSPGGVVATPFCRVALVGHSNGALISTFVQSTYADADALVNTGFVFTPHPLPVAPSDILALLGAPYIALPPSLRSALFYNPAAADPAVIDHDNATIADTFTRGQLLGLLAVGADPSLAGVSLVTGPVFVQLAENDVLQPAAYASADAALYASADSVTTAVVPSAGHSINGHLAARRAFAAVDAWLRDELFR